MSAVKPKGDVRTPLLGLVKLYSKVVIGASGAVSSQTAAGASGFTVAQSTTGRYTVTTDHQYQDLVHFSIKRFNNGTVKGANEELYAKYSSSVATFSIVNDAGAEENPASGDELWFELTFRVSDVGPSL